MSQGRDSTVTRTMDSGDRPRHLADAGYRLLTTSFEVSQARPVRDVERQEPVRAGPWLVTLFG